MGKSIPLSIFSYEMLAVSFLFCIFVAPNRKEGVLLI